MPSVFVPSEIVEGEKRVAATPDTVRRLIKDGFSVVVESGAGAGAGYSDAEYEQAGASVTDDAPKAMASADIVTQIHPPTLAQAGKLKEGASLVSFLWGPENLDLVGKLNEKRVSAFAMDAVPRTTRAQKDDALSSQANLAGYKAVLAAANLLPKIFPMLMTAAGTIRPAKVVVIGAGVAGLQAIATARRLGAIVEVSDVRPEVKEQAESLGASYIEVKDAAIQAGSGGYAAEQTEEFKRKQQEVLRQHLMAADVIICTALIPYRPAPKIVPADVVEKMRPGSVIVDLAAERGGNCELTESGRTVTRHGVTIVGETNWPATVAVHASDMYAKNIQNILSDNMKKGEFAWNMEDEINFGDGEKVIGALIAHGGEVLHPRTREAMGLPPLEKKAEIPEEPAAEAPKAEAPEEPAAEAPKAEESGESGEENEKGAEE